MITNDLQHLFDGTHCLSKRQMRDYAAGSMDREEAYAVESHLNTCPLCSAAADGMLAHFPESAGVLADVDAGFLKEHFRKHSPQIHLNTVAPTASAPVTRRIPGGRVIEFTSLRTMGIAAGVLLLIASLWWMQNGTNREERSLKDTAPIAQAEMPRNSSSGIPEAENRLARAGATSGTEEAERERSMAEKRKDESSSAVALMDAATAAAPESDAAFTPAPAAPTSPTVAAATSATSVEEAKTDKALLTSEPATQTLDGVSIGSSRYSRPLIEPAQPASRTVLAEKEIEKMPTRSTVDNASTSSSVYQSRNGSGMSIGGGRAENAEVVVDRLEDGKTLYKKGSYSAALKVLRSQISRTSGTDREEAILYAARCHRALGQNAAAKKLLQGLAEGSGSRARAARRELRAMDADTETPAAPRPAKAKAR